MEKTQLVQISELLKNNFSLTLPEVDIIQADNYLELLRDKLKERVLFYLRSNIDSLFQALYRIDVHDMYVNEAFDLGEIHLVSSRISELIIERQLQKLGIMYKFS